MRPSYSNQDELNQSSVLNNPINASALPPMPTQKSMKRGQEPFYQTNAASNTSLDDELNKSAFDRSSIYARQNASNEALGAQQSARSRDTYANPALYNGLAGDLDGANNLNGNYDEELDDLDDLNIGKHVSNARPSDLELNNSRPAVPEMQAMQAMQAMPPLARTATNQTTASAADARRELFGAAPQLSGATAEFDELNQTQSEINDAAAYSNVLGLNTLTEEDELNEMPSNFSSAPVQAFTFEDSEDEDVDFVKQEIKRTKQESVESTRRALQIASESEISGRNTLGMLGDQGERLGFAAKTVQLGNVQSRVAAENAEELQRLNRSIFIPNISNPFNSRRRNQLKEQKLKSQKTYDELEQQSLLEQQRETEQRVNDGLNSSGVGYSDTALRIRQRMNRQNPERQMYQFEADSEDEELEDELEQNLEGISDAAKRLHNLSLRINDEVTSQNARIEKMGDRVEDLDHKLHRTTAKMSTII